MVQELNRDHDLIAATKVNQIRPLEENLRYLKNRLPKAGKQELIALSEALGHHFLALAIASGQIATTRKLSISDYIAQFQEAREHIRRGQVDSWDIVQGKPVEVHLNLRVAFTLSWQQVTDPVQRKLFLIAAWCATDHYISYEVLAGTLVELSGDPLFPNGSKQEASRKKAIKGLVTSAIFNLKHRGLIKAKSQGLPIINTVTAHPLLVHLAREQDPDYTVLTALVKVLAKKTTKYKQFDMTYSFPYIVPHIVKAAVYAECAGLEEAGVLWSNLGYYYHKSAMFTEAREAYKHAILSFEAHLGPESPEAAAMFENPSIIYRDLKDLPAARKTMEP
jgi:hypothetical protein